MSEHAAPIFLYHGVRDAADDAIKDARYALPAASIHAQLSWLRMRGTHVASLAELLSFPPGWERACAITVDDCLKSAFTHLFPLIRDAGFAALFLPVVGAVGHRGWVGWDDLMEMQRAGMEIGSHGLSHADLTAISPDEARREIEDSKRILEERLGVRVRYFSLPGGFYSQGIRDLVAGAGYDALCGSACGYVTPRSDRFKLKRFCLGGNDGAAIVSAVTARRPRRLLVARVMRERGKDFLRAALGKKCYAAMRRALLPGDVPASLPRFPLDP